MLNNDTWVAFKSQINVKHWVNKLTALTSRSPRYSPSQRSAAGRQLQMRRNRERWSEYWPYKSRIWHAKKERAAVTECPASVRKPVWRAYNRRGERWHDLIHSAGVPRPWRYTVRSKYLKRSVYLWLENVVGWWIWVIPRVQTKHIHNAVGLRLSPRWLTNIIIAVIRCNQFHVQSHGWIFCIVMANICV